MALLQEETCKDKASYNSEWLDKFLLNSTNLSTHGHSAQGWRNCTLAVHERVNSRFLVLPGSLSIFTEITGHKYFSPLKPCREFKYISQ